MTPTERANLRELCDENKTHTEEWWCLRCRSWVPGDCVEENGVHDSCGYPVAYSQTLDSNKVIQLLDENEELRKAISDICTAIENLDGLQGHDAVVLRKHLLPCSDLDFCVVSNALKHAKEARKLLEEK